MLKAVLWLALIVFVMSILGWLTFNNSSRQTSITVDKARVEEDTRRAIEKVQDVTEDLRERVDRERETETLPPNSSDDPAVPDR